MGSIKKQRKKYSTPLHPWQAARIEEEKKIFNEYGLKNKKEIWRIDSLLRKFRSQAKKLIASTTEQSRKEEKLLIEKLFRLGLLSKDSRLDDILGLNIKALLERRLQTLVYRKDLARTMNQSRQFIIHGHVLVDNKKISVPSYLVKREEENKLSFISNSSLFNPEHPERIREEKLAKEKANEPAATI